MKIDLYEISDAHLPLAKKFFQMLEWGMGNARGSQRIWKMTTARDWVASDDDTNGAFLNCCDVLELNPEEIRERFKRAYQYEDTMREERRRTTTLKRVK